MIACRAAMLLVLIGAGSAEAAPVFPSDGTIGLEPPPGMLVQGNAFVRGGASISVRHMVKEAYTRPSNRSRETDEALGGPAARADPFPIGGDPGTIVRGRRLSAGVDYRVWDVFVDAPDETAAVYAMVPGTDFEVTDAQIEAALKTIVVRPPGLAARLGAFRKQPIVAAVLRFLEVAGICGFFISIGAWMFGPKRGAPRIR